MVHAKSWIVCLWVPTLGMRPASPKYLWAMNGLEDYKHWHSCLDGEAKLNWLLASDSLYRGGVHHGGNGMLIQVHSIGGGPKMQF